MILYHHKRSVKPKKLKALIIDDEQDICYLLGSLLKKKHFDMDYVFSLKEAKAMLYTNDPSIIFLDNHLPDGLGINFIGYIKSTHPLTKIVMITAQDTAADRKLALSAGADYFLSKPFTKEIINTTVEKLLN